MAATEIGSAYVQILPSAKGLGKSIEADLNDTSERSSKKFGQNLTDGITSGFAKVKQIAGAALTGAGAIAVKNFMSSAVNAYASYEQLVGGVRTLFGDSASIVEGYADNAFKTAGMSANQYMETVTGFSASLLQSLGGDTKKAAQQANLAVTDMSDNANKMGSNIADIEHAYQGFAKQNYTIELMSAA